MPARLLTPVLVGVLLLGAIACADTTTPDTGSGTPSADGALRAGEITVLAAASLTDVLGSIADEFEATTRGVTVSTSFAASSSLAAQIREGAPADVFASADEATMSSLIDENHVAGDPVVFARNRIAIAVAPGNPLGISGLADLTDPGVTYVAAGPSVPISRYAETALTAAGVTVRPVSEEADVRAVLTKVAAGEADAGIVYATDITASKGGVSGIELPADGVVVTAPAAVLREASRPDLAAAFVAFLTSPTAQRILADAGFGPV